MHGFFQHILTGAALCDIRHIPQRLLVFVLLPALACALLLGCNAEKPTLAPKDDGETAKASPVETRSEMAEFSYSYSGMSMESEEDRTEFQAESPKEGLADTYWRADYYYTEDQYGNAQVDPGGSWTVEFFLYADGSGSLRGDHLEDYAMPLTWKEEGGQLLLRADDGSDKRFKGEVLQADPDTDFPGAIRLWLNEYGEYHMRKKRFGMARLQEERADHNLIWITIEEMLWVHPDDHALIEQYGLPEDLDGYDYELIPLEKENIYIALKDGSTTFGVLNDGVFMVECDWEAFVERLLEYQEKFPDDSGIFVCFETRASDGMHEELARVEEYYVP